LGSARYSSRHVGLFFVCCFLGFCFVIPDIFEPNSASKLPILDYCLQIVVGYSFQTVWREARHIQAAVFGFG
jgi:hypothetical protein